MYDLFSFQTARSPERTCHEIVVSLDRLRESPFYERVKRLGSATPGRLGETLSQATMVRGLLPYITNDALADRDVGKRVGFWDPIEPGETGKRVFYDFFQSKEDESILLNVMNFFLAVRERWPVAWERNGRGDMIARTNGYDGLVRFLRPAYLFVTTKPRIVKVSEYKKIFDKSSLVDDDFNTEMFPPGSSGVTCSP